MKESKKISAIIVDDEPLARHGLREIIEEENDFEIVAESEDGESALQAIVRYEPDVVFLDIQMPEMDGFEVLANIPSDKLPLIVFVTAFDEFAIKAFTASALDYIVKPFDALRIRSSLHRIREMIRLKQSAEYSRRMMDLLNSYRSGKKYPERFSIRSSGKIYFISVDDIMWIEAAADYVHFNTRSGKHITRETIGSIEQQLDPSLFARIHRSCIVNLKEIRELLPLDHGEYTVTLVDGTILTASRTYKDSLSHLL